MPRYLPAIALLWALFGLMSVSVGLWDDLGLIISGLAGTATMLYRDTKYREPARVQASR